MAGKYSHFLVPAAFRSLLRSLSTIEPERANANDNARYLDPNFSLECRNHSRQIGRHAGLGHHPSPIEVHLDQKRSIRYPRLRSRNQTATLSGDGTR